MNKLLHGDCLSELSNLPCGVVALAYLDPPYNTGRDFGDFADKFESVDSYTRYIEERLGAISRVLSPTGSVYLQCDPKFSHRLRLAMDNVFGAENFRNEIAWCYTGPCYTSQHFPRKHDSILFYSRPGAVFNKDSIRIPYKSLSSGGFGASPALRRVMLNRGKVPEDWWVDITPLTGTHPEITGYATQKPIALLSRIILASSNEGDLVLDPFCGSGTTLVAAEQLGRRFVGIDANKDALRLTRERLDGSRLFQ